LVVRYRLEAYATLRRYQVAAGTRKRFAPSASGRKFPDITFSRCPNCRALRGGCPSDHIAGAKHMLLYHSSFFPVESFLVCQRRPQSKSGLRLLGFYCSDTSVFQSKVTSTAGGCFRTVRPTSISGSCSLGCRRAWPTGPCLRLDWQSLSSPN
jgi:hypothetical protein